MIVRIILAVLIVFVLWSGLDAVVHGVLLAPTYEKMANLWRAPDEMKIGLAWTTTAVAAACFVLVYALLVRPKSVGMGLLWGLLYGVGSGIGMGLGSYSYMPIPLELAAAWFGLVVVEALAAGLIVALVVGKPAPVIQPAEGAGAPQ